MRRLSRLVMEHGAAEKSGLSGWLSVGYRLFQVLLHSTSSSIACHDMLACARCMQRRSIAGDDLTEAYLGCIKGLCKRGNCRCSSEACRSAWV